jgi:prepilin-type N-terminal cleavage/methylation domain-containing protein
MRRFAKTKESGFTMLELLVAMVLFVVISASVWGVMKVALNSRNVVSNNVGTAKNVRLALNVMGRDAYNAGYGYPVGNTVILPDNKISTALGTPNDVDTTRDIVPPIIAGNNLNIDNWNSTVGARTDQVTFFYKDNTFNVQGSGSAAISTPLQINAATTTGTGVDQIVPITGSNSVCAVNDLYLINGNTGSTLGVVTALSGTNAVQFANGDPLGFNLSGASGTIRSISLPAAMYRVKMVTYFVATDGTLTRREYVNGPVQAGNIGYIDNPLVYNVEDLQIKYVMDDGTLSDNPSAGPDGIAGTADDVQANLARIRQVRFTITIKTTELRSDGQPYRETMTATYSTRNLGYDAS